MKDQLLCPHCGKPVKQYRNPFPTVDIIIEMASGSDEPLARTENNSIVLIKRKNPPYGWAIPGGFVDYGESLESAAVREMVLQNRNNVRIIVPYRFGVRLFIFSIRVTSASRIFLKCFL